MCNCESELDRLREQLAASNALAARLREALDGIVNIPLGSRTLAAIEIGREVLALTPAGALEEHDRAVREACARLLDEQARRWRDLAARHARYGDPMAFNSECQTRDYGNLAAAIRRGEGK